MNMASSPPRWIFQPLYTTIHHFYVLFLDKLKKSFMILKDFSAFVIRLAALTLTNKHSTQDVVVAPDGNPYICGSPDNIWQKKFLIFFENKPRRQEIIEFEVHFGGLTKLGENTY